ncbi:hypothetical protein EOM33_02210 [Candidatus Saccharibacteria bacterium]|jgi:hypothetical protein|nr:hypothetical protein [Candidatus Saccharibacteria bacterium]
MSDNLAITTNNPKYRKQLNTEQLEVLHILYTFRFASSEQIARYQEKPNPKAIQKRLKILEDQELIAKRYDKSYKLQGKPAAYYITAQGARTLAKLGDRPTNEPINTKITYKSKDASEGFIEHCKHILDTYLALYAIHGTKLDFFTKSDLNYEQYEYYPQPLPDAHIRLKTSKGDRNFFLDIFEDKDPFFIMVRRIKRYLKYAESGDWEETAPTVLMVTPNKATHKRLRKRIAYELKESYEDGMRFATTRLEYATDKDDDGKIWFAIDEDGDDPDEPAKSTTLNRLPWGDNLAGLQLVSGILRSMLLL